VKIVNLKSGGVAGGRYASGLAASCSREVPSYPRPQVRDDFLVAIMLDQPGIGVCREADAVAYLRLD
jgi:hypothetical protein